MSSHFINFKGSSNSTFDFNIYGHPTDHQLCDFKNRLLQQSSCGPLSLSDGIHSVFSEVWQEKVWPCPAISEGQTSLAACYSESEVQMLLVDIQSTAQTGADIHSTSLHQHHRVQQPPTLRSATHNRLILPRSKIKFGIRSFSVAGPLAWNLLPDDIRTSPSLVIIRNRLQLIVPGVS